MLLTIETLDAVGARLKDRLQHDIDQVNRTPSEDRHPRDVEHGLRVGIAHEEVDRVVGEICAEANWPVEYREPLWKEAALSLMPVAKAFDITEDQMLKVKPKQLPRGKELDHLGSAEQTAAREILGPQAADRVFARIRAESVEAVYRMPRREVPFAEFDADVGHIKCPRVNNAVLYGLELGLEPNSPQHVSPQMRAMAQSLLRFNNACTGRGVRPPLQEVTTALREFYTVHERDCLPYIVRLEDAGDLIFKDEPHLPAVRPESWAAAREEIRRVAGDKRFRDAELEILQAGLGRLEKPDSRPGVAEKLKIALGEHLTPDLLATLDDPTPEDIMAARKSLRLPGAEDDPKLKDDPEIEDRYRKWKADQKVRIPSIMDKEDWQPSFDSPDDFPRSRSH